MSDWTNCECKLPFFLSFAAQKLDISRNWCRTMANKWVVVPCNTPKTIWIVRCSDATIGVEMYSIRISTNRPRKLHANVKPDRIPITSHSVLRRKFMAERERDRTNERTNERGWQSHLFIYSILWSDIVRLLIPIPSIYTYTLMDSWAHNNRNKYNIISTCSRTFMWIYLWFSIGNPIRLFPQCRCSKNGI